MPASQPAAGGAALKGRTKGGAPEWHFVDEEIGADAAPSSWWNRNQYIMRLGAVLLVGVVLFILVDVREFLYVSQKDKATTWAVGQPVWQKGDIVKQRMAHVEHIPEVEAAETALEHGPVVTTKNKSHQPSRPLSVGKQGPAQEDLPEAAGPVIHPHRLSRKLLALAEELERSRWM